MRRENFPASLPGAIAVPPPTKAAAATPRRVLIQESPVAGFQYREGENLRLQRQEGDAPSLVRVDWRGEAGFHPAAG